MRHNLSTISQKFDLSKFIRKNGKQHLKVASQLFLGPLQLYGINLTNEHTFLHAIIS